MNFDISVIETSLLIALLLFLVDFLFLSDLPSFGAYTIIAALAAYYFPASFLSKVIFGILFWLTTVAVHYFIFKALIRWIANYLMIREKYDDPLDRIVGKKGIVRILNKETFAVIQDELIPIRSLETETLSDGDYIEIKENRDDVFYAAKIHSIETGYTAQF